MKPKKVETRRERDARLYELEKDIEIDPNMPFLDALEQNALEGDQASEQLLKRLYRKPRVIEMLTPTI